MTKKKSDTLRILALSYSWITLLCAPIFMLTGDVAMGFGVLTRGILFLTFMYAKHNWRVLILILSAIGVLTAISEIDNIFYLIDIAGNVVVFLYALHKRK